MGLRDQVRSLIPEHAFGFLSDHFDVIGDIAVLSLQPPLTGYRHIIAEAIVSRRHNIKTVLVKTSPVRGIKRTACYEAIIGSESVTVHHEYGFAYRLDVSTVFYNPRLARERKRVTEQVTDRERVLIPCCGVGPFVIPAAARGAHIVAVENNPEAYRWLCENISFNDVQDNVCAINADACDTTLLPEHTFDRAIIPTPYGMDRIFEVIAPKVKSGGMIHFYTFKNRNQAEAMVGEFRQKRYEVVLRRSCGNIAPGVNRWVFDLLKKNFPDQDPAP